MRRATIAVALILGWAGSANAQSQCSTSLVSDATTRYCNALVEAAGITLPRAGIAASGGNPVPGASSTLGMRIGSIPRITFGWRFTGAHMELPPIQRMNSADEISTLITSHNLDVAIGIFSGFTIAPTIGGFGSLDFVGSFGTVRLSSDEGFTQKPKSWAAGARVGFLRESFTAPGFSVTAIYRHLGDIKYGDRSVTGNTDGEFTLRDNSAVSVRAVVGKRLFVLGANAGIGYDKYSAAMTVHSPGFVNASHADLETDRITAFANVSWTMLILNIVAEAGRQQGGHAFTAPLPSGQQSRSENAAFYGSLAIRLAL